MNHRENTLRAARFEHPEHIPVSIGIGPACWNHYQQDALQELMAEHPLLYPGFRPSDEPIRPTPVPWRRAEHPHTDSWGCVWETAMDGITGAVVKHALPDWSDFESYVPPSPDEQSGWTPIDWDDTARHLQERRRKGGLVTGGLRHGHTFLTLTYIRGYENLIFDMADNNPNLHRLIRMVEDFNAGLVERYLACGVELMCYPEDLGMQQGPMLSPDQFRQFIKPSCQRLIAPARAAGCVIHMHSDGDIRALCNDLLDIGLDVLNLQDLVNGIEWIAATLKGRVCIDLDIDRQNITRFGTPQQVDDHIRTCVETLNAPEGGLMLKHGLYPGIPLENIAALMDAMERYAFA